MPASPLLEQLRGRSLEEQFKVLDAASRERALDHQESLKLEQVVRELDRRGGGGKRGAPFGDRRYRDYRR